MNATATTPAATIEINDHVQPAIHCGVVEKVEICWDRRTTPLNFLGFTAYEQSYWRVTVRLGVERFQGVGEKLEQAVAGVNGLMSRWSKAFVEQR